MKNTDYMEARSYAAAAERIAAMAHVERADGHKATAEDCDRLRVKFAARAAILRAAYAEEASGVDILAMARGYAGAHLGTTYHAADENGDASDRPLDHDFDIDDLPVSYWTHAHERVASFVQAHPLACRMYVAARGGGAVGSGDLGHYFYMDQEGEGVGMWDRGLGDLGYYLSRMTDEREEDHSVIYVDPRGDLAHDNPAAELEP